MQQRVWWLAYHNSWLALAEDYELIVVEPSFANPVVDQLKTKSLNIGVEFDAFDYAQLHFGASNNIASGIPGGAKNTAYTAGIGFLSGC